MQGSKDKIKKVKDLRTLLEGLKKSKKRIVFTNGCFDIIHYGHVKYLEEAKKKGDVLVVAVNSDRSVRSIKAKGRPIVDESSRMGVVAGLESVDFVTIFDEDTPLEVIKILLPDVLVKGGDWRINEIAGSEAVKSNGGKVLTIPFVEGYSSTNIINRMKNCG